MRKIKSPFHSAGVYFVNRLLKDLLAIKTLSDTDRHRVVKAVKDKYGPALVSAIGILLFMLPALFFIEAESIQGVLIPVVFVSGTAWFAISLASMRDDLSDFGIQLTYDLLVSFISSLLVLFIIVVLAINPWIKGFIVSTITQGDAELANGISIVSGILAALGLARIFFKLISGTIKYDANDSMLSGQNEKAEIYFKRALSDLRRTAADLRRNLPLHLANYHLSWALEYFCLDLLKTKAHSKKSKNIQLREMVKVLQEIRANPDINQLQADKAFVTTIKIIMEQISGNGREEQKEELSEYYEIVAHINNGVEYLEGDRSKNSAIQDARFARVLDLLSDLTEKYHDVMVENMDSR